MRKDTYYTNHISWSPLVSNAVFYHKLWGVVQVVLTSFWLSVLRLVLIIIDQQPPQHLHIGPKTSACPQRTAQQGRFPLQEIWSDINSRNAFNIQRLILLGGRLLQNTISNYLIQRHDEDSVASTALIQWHGGDIVSITALIHDGDIVSEQYWIQYPHHVIVSEQ